MDKTIKVICHTIGCGNKVSVLLNHAYNGIFCSKCMKKNVSYTLPKGKER